MSVKSAQTRTTTIRGFALPPAIRYIGKFGPSGAEYMTMRGMKIIETLSDLPDDSREWQHVSCSYPKRLPTYDDLVRVKDIFVGSENEAYFVFPPKSQHVNIHEYCLHLWSCLEGPVLPRFGVGGTI